MWNLVFLFTGLVFIILLIVVFFSKERIKSKENTIFKILVITNLVGFIIEIVMQLIVRNYGSNNFFVSPIAKLYLIYIYSWFTVFSIYTFLISYIKNGSFQENNEYKMIKYTHITAIVLGILAIIIMPIEKYYKDGMMYSYGQAVTFLKIMLGAYIIVWAIRLFINIKSITQKKNYPIIITILMLVANIIIQSINPSILIATFTMTYTCYILFFTIENPDLKLLSEIKRNKKLMEDSLEDKSNMLFKISQDVKSPINDIEVLSNKIIYTDSLEETHSDAKDINELSKDVNRTINSVLNITDYDMKNIKIMNNYYNTYNIFEELIILAKEKKSKNVNFKYNISHLVPKKLSGDSLKLKQIIYSVLNNAINNTIEGIIDLDISCIIKNNVCRLIIDIRDTGKGIEINKINEILEDSNELDESEVEKITSLDVGLKVTKKIIDMMGGTLLIKSELGKGTDITIIVNQIVTNVTSENDYAKLADSISNKKKVFLLDDNYEELEDFKNELKKYSADITSTMFSDEMLDKINNNNNDYDLLLIDDELGSETAISLINKINNKNINIIIMLNKEKESIKNNYLKEYHFNDYLLKSEYSEEIKRISKKYL